MYFSYISELMASWNCTLSISLLVASTVPPPDYRVYYTQTRARRAVDLFSSQNTEARPTPKSKETTLAIKNTRSSKPTQSTYAIKKIIIEANTTTSPIGQAQSNLIPALFI